MRSVSKYIKKKSADGAVFKITLATLALFNLAYFVSQPLSHGENFNFFKDIEDPRTYSYIIASSIIIAVLISSFIFYKIKTKELGCGKDHEVITVPNQIVIEIPVEFSQFCSDYDIFRGITFTGQFSKPCESKSRYPIFEMESTQIVIDRINASEISFFKLSDYEKCKKGDLTLECSNGFVMFKSNGDSPTIIEPIKFFKLTELYNVCDIKFNCVNSSVNLKLTKKLQVDVELVEHINSTMPRAQLEELEIMFIPALVGYKPIFNGSAQIQTTVI